MEKILNFAKKNIVFLILVLCGIGMVSAFTMKVNAESYTELDFTDIKNTYNFNGKEYYGDLDTKGWKLTKNDHDYTLELKDAKLSKLVLPTDDADIDCFNSLKCGEKPRMSKVTVKLYGNNEVQNGGVIANYVKSTTFTGEGKLTVNTKNNHGISIYSDAIFNNVNITVNSHFYGINTNHSLTLYGGHYKIESGDSALISAEDMKIENSTIDAKIKRDNDNYLAATEGVIESRRNVDIDNATITVQKGPNGIYGKDITINRSTIKDNGEKALYATIIAKGGFDNGHEKIYHGDLVITNSTIDVSGTEHALQAIGDMTINDGTYNLSSSAIRTAVVDAGTKFVLEGNAKLNADGKGFAIAVRSDKGSATFKSGTEVTLSATRGSSVADKSAVDQIAVSSRETFIENNVKFEAWGANSVFSYRPTLATGAYYIDVAEAAEKNPNMLKYYIQRKSKEKLMMFHSSYRYVHIVPVMDLENPVITGYVKGKQYCELPTLTVSDDIGIDTVTVNGTKITKFSYSTDTLKKFMVPILNSPIKEVVVKDVVGKTTTAKLTAYNGCYIDINGKVRLSFGKTLVYDGKEKKPIISAYYYDRKLKENADYKVTYKNNVNPGTATIEVTGIGGFEGTITDTFTIVKADNVITASNVTKKYSSKAQSFSLNAKQKGNAKLTYSSNNKSITVNSAGKVTIKKGYVGKATITITANANTGYNKATKKVTITVNPATVQVSKLSNVKGKKMTVKWAKNSNITGYQIQYSTNSSFKTGVKTVTVSKNSTTSKTISGLSKGKKYYVRIHTYKTVSGVKYYSNWSTVKSVKISK